MNPEELQALSDEELDQLIVNATEEQTRRARLADASAQVAAVLAQVSAAGGDADQVITEAQTMAKERVDSPLIPPASNQPEPPFPDAPQPPAEQTATPQE